MDGRELRIKEVDKERFFKLSSGKTRDFFKRKTENLPPLSFVIIENKSG